MLIAELNGYEIHLPTSGGKAGKGYAETGTIQVRRSGCIVKQFRFTMDDKAGRVGALKKAKSYVSPKTPKAVEFAAL